VDDLVLAVALGGEVGIRGVRIGRLAHVIVERDRGAYFIAWILFDGCREEPVEKRQMASIPVRPGKRRVTRTDTSG
jgi:hypothetical protein